MFRWLMTFILAVARFCAPLGAFVRAMCSNNLMQCMRCACVLCCGVYCVLCVCVSVSVPDQNSAATIVQDAHANATHILTHTPARLSNVSNRTTSTKCTQIDTHTLPTICERVSPRRASAYVTSHTLCMRSHTHTNFCVIRSGANLRANIMR